MVANLSTAQAQRANSTSHAARHSHPEPRPHKALGYLSPQQYRAQQLHAVA